MRYVSDASYRVVLEMEDALKKLPPDAGVLFVSVSAEPVEGGDSRSFKVCIGMSRKFDEGTGTALVKHVLNRYLADRVIETRVFRGVPGACRDDCTATAGSPAA